MPPGQIVRGRSSQGWNSTEEKPFEPAKEIDLDPSPRP
jgi:hypothetical protein